MSQFPDGEDDHIEDLVAEALFQEDLFQEESEDEFPIKADGSGPRVVKRQDYSRGKKEAKLDVDPRFS
jgi:hypothetical protein